MKHRFDDFDVVKLANRIATMISYEIPKREIVDTLRAEGVSDDHIWLGYAASRMILDEER